MTETNLIGEKNGSIYTITLNRPKKRNAINVEMFTGICELAENQAGDPDIRAIILKGEGEMFSAGVDFNSLGAEVAACLGEGGAGGGQPDDLHVGDVGMPGDLVDDLGGRFVVDVEECHRIAADLES